MPTSKKPVVKAAPKAVAKASAAKEKSKAVMKKVPAISASAKPAPVKQPAAKAAPAKPSPVEKSAKAANKADLVADNNVTLPPNYKPSEKEDYMNPKMLAYFKGQLERWKQDLLSDSNDTLESLSDGGMQEPDITDRATAETDRALEFRTRDRERKLIRKIEEALHRIEADDFGFCEETGEPIGIKRLMARPIATLTVEAQERHERQERTQRDEADE